MHIALSDSLWNTKKVNYLIFNMKILDGKQLRWQTMKEK